MQRQTELPFAMGEASRAERLNLLGLALTRVEADCHLAVFCRWVFNVTAGGREDGGELLRSYKQLAARPWGLCCSASKARATVGRARQLGLVAVREERYASGGQRSNGYRIDWTGVRSILGLRSSPTDGEGPDVPAALREQGGVLTEHPPALREQGGVFTEHPYRESPSLCPSLNSLSVPGPVPEAATGAEEVFQRAPVLADARKRVVRPLPAAGLFGCGVFGEIEDRHLRRPTSLVEWFRRQLSAARPVAAGNEAELILVLAAARHAIGVPAGELRKSWSAIFAGIVGRRRWNKVGGELSAAVAELDRLKARHGCGLLEGEQWPPEKVGNRKPEVGSTP